MTTTIGRTVYMELSCGHAVIWNTVVHDDLFESWNAGAFIEDWCEEDECNDYREVVG